MQHMNDVLKAFNALFNPALSITPGSSYPSASLAYSIPPTPQYPIPWNEQYSMREFKEKWALCGVKAYNEYYTVKTTKTFDTCVPKDGETSDCWTMFVQ